MSAQEIAVRAEQDLDAQGEHGLWLERMDLARRAIEAAQSLEELKQINDFGEAAKAFARAKKSREMAKLANEVGLRAQRRAGQLLLEIPVRLEGQQRKEIGPRRKAAEAIGLDDQIQRKWQRLARIPDDVFDQAIDELKGEAGRDLTYMTVLRQISEVGVRAVESGIFLLRDGRYRIVWREAGKKCASTLSYGVTLTKARGVRQRRQEIARRVKPSGRGSLAASYSLTRRLLAELTRAKDEASAAARAEIDEALNALYEAEDAVLRAMKKQ